MSKTNSNSDSDSDNLIRSVVRDHPSVSGVSRHNHGHAIHNQAVATYRARIPQMRETFMALPVSAHA